MNSSKRTEIKQILGKWSIGDGVVQTEDVAFSTSLNRLAFFGRFDFVNDTIPGYTAYVLDRRGCSLMDQRVYGKMNDLRVDKLNISETLFGSVVNFVNALVGKNCKPVYTGEVAHPN